MFRGGGTVSSYGNGIATGLAKGGMPGKRGLVTGPGGYAGELFGGSINANVPQAQYSGGATTNTGGNILSRNVNKLKNLSLPKGKNIEARLGKGIKSLYNLLPKKGLLETGSKFAMKNFPKITKGAGITAALSGPSMVADISRPQTYAALQYMKENSKNNAGVFDETAFDDFTEYDTEFQKLNDTSKYEAMPDNRGFMNKLLNPFSGFTGLREKSDKEIGLIVDQDNKKIAEKEDAAAADTGKETTVDTSGNPMPTESRKDRLKRTAKEYQEILGDGIKKDSIFDAMVTGGTALMEGEGFASAARNINKSLDPVQNIKTASRKLALEEDIAMRKAMAVSAGKSTEMSRRIAAMRAAGRTPEQIADMVAGIKPESLGEKVSKLGKVDGYAEYIKENRTDVEVVTSKVDISKKPKGKYYIADKFIIVEIDENGNKISEEVIKNS
jgi:hypothetical protein